MQRRSVIAMLAALSLAACDGQRLTSPPIIIGRSSSASVRVVNASSSVAGFDLAVGGSVGTGDSGIAFGTASQCRAITPGSLVGIRVAGSGSDLPNFASPSLADGDRATVLVTGSADSLRFTTLFDDRNTPPAGRSRVRVFNASRAGDVDVRFGPAGSATTLIADLGRDEVSSFIDLPAGSTEISFLDSDTGATVLGAQALTLGAGQSRTIVLGDPAAGSSTLRTFDFQACP